MTPGEFRIILVLIILLVLSAYFAATEIAYAGLNKVRLKNMANNGNKRAAKALALMDKYDSLLSTVLIGNSIVTIAAASIATIIFVLHFGDKGVAISTITMTIIILIFGEIIPKSLAKEMPESWALGSAGLLRFFMILLWPITCIFGLIQKLFAKILKTNERPSTSEDELMIIVDEAHNLPDHLRDVMTARYGVHALDRAEGEAKEWKDPEVSAGISATMVTAALRKLMHQAEREFLTDEDGLIPPYFLEDGLMEELGVTSMRIRSICKALIEHGEIVAETKKTNGKLPRSYMRSLGMFILFWLDSEDEIYVKLIIGGDTAFEAFCMDPYLAAEPLRSCFASVHMSGTLEPLTEYQNVLGLEDAKLGRFASPFDPANLAVMHAADVTTKYDDVKQDASMVPKTEDHIVAVIGASEKNTAVFFPSYSMMDLMIRDGVPERTGRRMFVEMRSMTNQEHQNMVDEFRHSAGGVLYAVSGGRISEGIDFPGKDLEIVILVGMPFARPGAKLNALIRYYDIRSGNGWEHAVTSPAIRKMRQAIGRLIRSEDDIGAAVILDRRAAMYPLLASSPSADPAADAARFFADRENGR